MKKLFEEIQSFNEGRICPECGEYNASDEDIECDRCGANLDSNDIQAPFYVASKKNENIQQTKKDYATITRLLDENAFNDRQFLTAAIKGLADISVSLRHMDEYYPELDNILNIFSKLTSKIIKLKSKV